MTGTTESGARGWLARWERFWFGEASLVRLAVFRIVLLGAAFDGAWLVRRAVFQRADRLDPVFLERSFDPIHAFQLLGLGPPGPIAARLVWVALLASIALGILGLCTRLSCALAALLTFYWIGIEYSFGKPHHTCVALVFGLCALPLAPVGARLSLDSLLRRLRAARRGGDPLAVPARAAWAALPLRLTQLTIAIGYFFAGASKLARSGPDWANGYTLQGIMVEYDSAWSSALVGHHALLVVMSFGLLFGQLGFPLVFAWSPARWVFLPLVILFHVMAMQTMATGTFLTLWFALAAFVALERVPDWLARVVGAGPVWRRALSALVLAGLTWATLAIYLAKKPEWLPWLLVPIGFAVLLWSLPGLAPPLEVRYDPRDPGQARAIACLSAADWGRRIAFLSESPRASLAVYTAAPRELRGLRAAFALLVRLPLAPFVLPFVLPFASPRAATTKPDAGR